MKTDALRAGIATGVMCLLAACAQATGTPEATVAPTPTTGPTLAPTVAPSGEKRIAFASNFEGSYDIYTNLAFYCDCVGGYLSWADQQTIVLPSQQPQLQGPSSLMRGQSAAFQVVNAGQAQISGWEYVPSDSSIGTISRSGSGASWSGVIVASGTVRVTVGTQTLALAVQVQPRDFATPTPPAEAVPNRTPVGCLPTPYGPALSLPVPVVNGVGTLGQSCAELRGTALPNEVPAGGPNGGIKWIERLDPNDPLRWQYRWVINPDVDDLNCAFSLLQLGDYHSVNSPTGWISGANLRANTRRHESGSVSSHYAMFAAAKGPLRNKLFSGS